MSTETWQSRRFRPDRHFRGVRPRPGKRRGVRVHGSVDGLVQGLRSLGWGVIQEPVENGLAPTPMLGALRTWGSPWVDLWEAEEQEVLGPRLAEELSSAISGQVLWWEHDHDAPAVAEQLYDQGMLQETLDWTDRSDPIGALLERYRERQMRDWGMDLADLVARRLPFEPQLVVEAWVLALTPPGGER